MVMLTLLMTIPTLRTFVEALRFVPTVPAGIAVAKTLSATYTSVRRHLSIRHGNVLSYSPTAFCSTCGANVVKYCIRLFVRKCVLNVIYGTVITQKSHTKGNRTNCNISTTTNEINDDDDDDYDDNDDEDDDNDDDDDDDDAVILSLTAPNHEYSRLIILHIRAAKRRQPKPTDYLRQ